MKELELLERSLSGLMSNIEKFKNHGIMPYQIITVVINLKYLKIFISLKK
jgi:hypothetical protein